MDKRKRLLNYFIIEFREKEFSIMSSEDKKDNSPAFAAFLVVTIVLGTIVILLKIAGVY
jgi:hypothetical protein